MIAAFIAIFAPWIVETFIAKGFPPEQKALTTSLMRYDLIAIMIFSISGLVMASLQANQHFLLPALAPTMYNLGQIFGAGYLAPDGEAFMGLANFSGRGMGVYGMVYGVIIGAALHLLIQLPGLIKFGFRWAPKIELRSEPVQKVLRLLGPRVLTMFFIQMFFIVRDYVASFMDEGAITALNNGWFIMQVPETLLGTTVAIALLPTISEIFARGEKEEFRQTINGALRVILALTIPVGPLHDRRDQPADQGCFRLYRRGDRQSRIGYTHLSTRPHRPRHAGDLRPLLLRPAGCQNAPPGCLPQCCRIHRDRLPALQLARIRRRGLRQHPGLHPRSPAAASGGSTGASPDC